MTEVRTLHEGAVLQLGQRARAERRRARHLLSAGDDGNGQIQLRQGLPRAAFGSPRETQRPPWPGRNGA